MPFNGSRMSELQFHLHGDHSRAAIATQAHTEQASRRRCRIGEGSKSCLRRGVPRNAG